MSIEGPVAILLSAGQGKRMKSDKAKVLHEVSGQPMIRYVVNAARAAGARSIVVVVGFGADQVRSALAEEPDVFFVDQPNQLGTGDAVKVCRPLLDGFSGPAFVLVGDMPLIRPEPLAQLLQQQQKERAACYLGTAILPDPTGFGRILRDSAGRFLKIVEQRDCTTEELQIREVNPSCYVFDLPGLWDALDQLDTQNSQKEYYLTDAPSLLQAMGRKVLARSVLEADDVLGVNTREHLAQANAIMQSRIANHWMTEGVTIVDPRNTFIDSRAEVGRETVIFPFTVISGKVQIGERCRVGPFSHLRDGTRLDHDVEVGAFVEISRSHLESGTIARHLSYLGQSHLGRNVNVGAGVITANYDGREKHPTEIGADAFIGSGAIMIAPVTVGQGSFIGAGAVVTKRHDVSPGSTVVGIPARPLSSKTEPKA